MWSEQTVSEMVQEILSRQARALVERTGQTFESALETVSKTVAGRKLVELGNNSHRDEKASDWQESLLRERTQRLLARLAVQPVDTGSWVALPSVAADHHYSWLEGYLAWLKGKEARNEYYAVLERELRHLKRSTKSLEIRVDLRGQTTRSYAEILLDSSFFTYSL